MVVKGPLNVPSANITFFFFLSVRKYVYCNSADITMGQPMPNLKFWFSNCNQNIFMLSYYDITLNKTKVQMLWIEGTVLDQWHFQL